MNQFWKYTLMLIGGNILLILASLAAESFFGVLLIAFLGQLLAGTIMCFDAGKRTLGQAMLAACSILLVVGFSVCTLLLVNG
ncbi:hypothetical protein C7T94_06615 [Pedobacter yulinensis]|uniref:DUF3953 domain-containing protein n=1 Tax=Pedobacter yulinensis TaxID=2126353 RepID=A0A2T3HPK3_9SPHI|nr:hypothetical protein [Pedobacter yulinensis]PST84378.1 hypothetical protein C7T94_06615 [Pedobacter yulinensis]